MSASLSHWRESVLSGLAGEGRLRLVGRGLLLLLCLAAPAGAATVHEGSIMMDLEWAHSVVTATIGPSRVEVDHRGLPQTVYELTDVEGIKGAPPYPFEIRIDGGVADALLTLEVPGAPKFTAGDRVLLFLRMDHPVAPIIGLQTRSFRISGGRGDAHVRTYDGRPVLGLDGQLRIQAGSSEDGPGLSLEQFVGLLREMMSHPNYRDRSR